MLRRTILQSFFVAEKTEVAGFHVRRAVGGPQLGNLSPFLMLDHFRIGLPAGFPDHPHRGQETITYVFSGTIDHEDFTGHAGTLQAGDLQFMTAGRGIVHTELPGTAPVEGGYNHGIQLWLDLPKDLRYCEPRYRNLGAQAIPQVTASDGNVNIKVISGKSQGVESVKDLTHTPVWFLDITISPGGHLAQPLPEGWNAFMYILNGAVNVHTSEDPPTRAAQFHNVVFNREGDGVELSVPEVEAEETRVLLVAGQVLDQEVVRHGPFVVNSQEEVDKALKDYQNYTNGFERAKGWKSEIGKRVR